MQGIPKKLGEHAGAGDIVVQPGTIDAKLLIVLPWTELDSVDIAYGRRFRIKEFAEMKFKGSVP